MQSKFRIANNVCVFITQLRMYRDFYFHNDSLCALLMSGVLSRIRSVCSINCENVDTYQKMQKYTQRITGPNPCHFLFSCLLFFAVLSPFFLSLSFVEHSFMFFSGVSTLYLSVVKRFNLNSETFSLRIFFLCCFCCYCFSTERMFIRCIFFSLKPRLFTLHFLIGVY